MTASPQLIATVVGAFYLFFLVLILLGVRRGAQSGCSWNRTTGRVQSFGVSNGIPDVTYTYHVDGLLLKSCAFVPGPIAKKSAGIKLPKSAYLHDDGRMKFEPNTDVDVFYNPNDPEDAVLIPGIQRSSLIAVVVLAFLPVIAFFGWSHSNELSRFFQDERHMKQGVGVFFFLGGMMPLFFGISYWRRSRRVHRFESTTGRLLNTAVMLSSGEGNSYQLSVSYEYEVDGRRYHSTQWSSLPNFWVGRSKASVQAQIDTLQAEPQLTVHYDPTCPWDAFLRSGPTGLAFFLTGLMALAFWGVGVACFFLGK